MGFDGSGGELRGFYFVPLFLVDSAFHFLLRDGKRDFVGVGTRIGQAAIDIVGGSGGDLGMVSSDQFDVNVGEGDGLISVVGDNEKNGKKSVFAEVNRENFGFVGAVIGIGGDSDLFVGVIVMHKIGFGGVGGGFDEVFGGEAKRESCDSACDS